MRNIRKFNSEKEFKTAYLPTEAFSAITVTDAYVVSGGTEIETTEYNGTYTYDHTEHIQDHTIHFYKNGDMEIMCELGKLHGQWDWDVFYVQDFFNPGQDGDIWFDTDNNEEEIVDVSTEYVEPWVSFVKETFPSKISTTLLMETGTAVPSEAACICTYEKEVEYEVGTE